MCMEMKIPLSYKNNYYHHFDIRKHRMVIDPLHYILILVLPLIKDIRLELICNPHRIQGLVSGYPPMLGSTLNQVKER